MNPASIDVCVFHFNFDLWSRRLFVIWGRWRGLSVFGLILVFARLFKSACWYESLHCHCWTSKATVTLLLQITNTEGTPHGLCMTPEKMCDMCDTIIPPCCWRFVCWEHISIRMHHTSTCHQSSVAAALRDCSCSSWFGVNISCLDSCPCMSLTIKHFKLVPFYYDWVVVERGRRRLLMKFES